jgi:DNA-binding CsgD family transcriptional regulator
MLHTSRDHSAGRSARHAAKGDPAAINLNTSLALLWQGLLDSAEDTLACRNASVILRWPKQNEFGRCVTPRFDPASAVEFHGRSFAADPFGELADGKVRILHEHIKRAALPAHPFYKDFLGPYKINDILGLDLIGEQTHAAFRFRFIRAAGDPFFGEGERRRLAIMMPALRTAARLYARSAATDVELETYKQTADQLEVASFILNDARTVVHKNDRAAEIIRAKDGFLLSNAMLSCFDRDDHRRLLAAFEACAQAAQQNHKNFSRTLLVRRPEGGHWSVLLRPVGVSSLPEGATSPSVAVLVRGQRQHAHVPASLLMDVFGLTLREAEIAARLAHGEVLNDIAAGLAIRYTTARVHLRSIFTKVQVNSQAQLVAMLVNLAHGTWS